MEVFVSADEAAAGHAHNGYLNLVMTTGLIGVGLFMLWMLICPLLDYHRTHKTTNDPALTRCIYEFGLLGCFMPILKHRFFAPRGQVWFSLLAAVLALRLHARAQIRQSVHSSKTDIFAV